MKTVYSERDGKSSRIAPACAPFVFLGTNDPTVKHAGMRQDVAPTILARFGLELSKVKPPLDGETLTEPATKPFLKSPEKRGGIRHSSGRRKRMGNDGAIWDSLHGAAQILPNAKTNQHIAPSPTKPSTPALSDASPEILA